MHTEYSPGTNPLYRVTEIDVPRMPLLESVFAVNVDAGAPTTVGVHVEPSWKRTERIVVVAYRAMPEMTMVELDGANGKTVGGENDVA